MVEQSSITQMAKLMAIVNDKSTAQPALATPRNDGVTAAERRDDDNVTAMKTILERFYRTADNAAETLVEETQHDRTLRDAMMLEQTADGVTLGVWQIRAKTDSGRKLYDVIRIDQSQPIAQDLTIYEAARGLASALNDGLPITSRRIRDLLTVEEDYANAVHNAIHAKHALSKQALSKQAAGKQAPGAPPDNAQRRAILEDKYGAAVRRGHAARQRIFAMVGRG